MRFILCLYALLLPCLSSAELIRQPLREVERFISPPPISWGVSTSFDFQQHFNKSGDGFFFNFIYDIYAPHLKFGANELYFLLPLYKRYLVHNLVIRNDTLYSTGNNMSLFGGITGATISSNIQNNTLVFGIGSEGKFPICNRNAIRYYVKSEIDLRKIVDALLVVDYCITITKRASLIPSIHLSYSNLTMSDYVTRYFEKGEFVEKILLNFKINLSSISSLMVWGSFGNDKYVSCSVGVRTSWDW